MLYFWKSKLADGKSEITCPKGTYDAVYTVGLIHVSDPWVKPIGNAYRVFPALCDAFQLHLRFLTSTCLHWCFRVAVIVYLTQKDRSENDTAELLIVKSKVDDHIQI